MKLSYEFIENTYGWMILHFLWSKDDSLLLLITSLIYNFTMSDHVDPSILFESNLYPIGQWRKALLTISLLEAWEEPSKSPMKWKSIIESNDWWTSAKDL